jgi:hypothetical protein
LAHGTAFLGHNNHWIRCCGFKDRQIPKIYYGLDRGRFGKVFAEVCPSLPIVGETRETA